MKKLLNKEGLKLFSKNSNTIIFIVLVLIAYLVFGTDEESIIMNFLKYFTDILNIW
jgi:hypothetical protein